MNENNDFEMDSNEETQAVKEDAQKSSAKSPDSSEEKARYEADLERIKADAKKEAEEELKAQKEREDKMDSMASEEENMQEFQMLLSEGSEMEKKLQEKNGGLVTVDDTMERVQRQEAIVRTGRRKGNKFKPGNGTTKFLIKQNALYKSQGKIPPYSEEVIRETFLYEKGMKKVK